MRTRRINLSLAVVANDLNEPPVEMRLLTAPKVESLRGEFVFDEEAAHAVMSADSVWNNDYHFDYDHGSEVKDATGPRPAAGWFRIELRNGELWAKDIRWTKAADRMIREKEYRFISPTFDYEKGTRRITRFVSSALTNNPATFNAPALTASLSAGGEPEEDDDMALLATLISLWGLPTTATEADAIAHATTVSGAQREMLSATGRTNLAEASAVIGQLRADLSAEKAKVAAAETAAKAVADQAREREVEEILRGALSLTADDKKFWLDSAGADSDGKGADPAKLRPFIERATARASLSINTAPTGAAPPVHQTPPGGSVTVLPAHVLESARIMKIDPNELAASLRGR